MIDKTGKSPFKTLGQLLQGARQRLKETVAEVSGAVEIEESTLQRIEEGQERPSEDILLLLITHFGVQDDEAVRLWDLAGYDRSNQPKTEVDLSANRSFVMVMAVDSRIIYSDKVEVVANPNGVVLNFLQAPDGPYQPQTVARIGMSREQSANVVKVLQQTLVQSAKVMQPKDLPSPESKSKPKADRQ